MRCCSLKAVGPGVGEVTGLIGSRRPPRKVTQASIKRSTPPPIANKRQPKDHQAARPRDYGAAAGTTLMLLNGEPLISLVLTTV